MIKAEDLPDIIRSSVPKSVFQRLLTAAAERRAHAFKCVDLIGVDGGTAASLTGMAHSKLLDGTWGSTAADFDLGIVEKGAPFPGSDQRSYQKLLEVGGILLAHASIDDPRALPKRVLTRERGCALFNRGIEVTPRLPFCDPEPPSDIKFFAIILTCRNRASLGELTDVAIGIVDAAHRDYIYYEDLKAFIDGYGEDSDEAAETVPAAPAPDAELAMAMKKGVKPFIGGETDIESDDEEKSKA